ncbi:MAG: crossover junction endodeoxyribonuclease RuvC [Patescibacteria group bacterium]
MSLNPIPQVVLAIDPGYDRLGWAVGQKKDNKIKVQAYGLIQTDKKMILLERYRFLINQLENIIGQYQPSELAIETVFFSTNKKTALQVSETRGVIIATALRKGMRVFEYMPNQVKLTVTGYGKADKKAVEKMVRLELAIKEKMIDDTLDALAILITHQASAKLAGI